MIEKKTEQRVVITGMGIVCPLGHDVETVWAGLLEGKSGVAKTTIFDASTFPTTFDAEVKDYDLAKYTKHPFCYWSSSSSLQTGGD
ncbi:MAG: beta-ketoacyl synthase N-terminal-like domain-containing protein [Planctomycetota bacterium]|jgi:3-oxoacyl-[acyl-carrier-protein] synthase II